MQTKPCPDMQGMGRRIGEAAFATSPALFFMKSSVREAASLCKRKANRRQVGEAAILPTSLRGGFRQSEERNCIFCSAEAGFIGAWLPWPGGQGGFRPEAPICGSSPRTWGRLTLPPPPGCAPHRFIPTHVGQTANFGGVDSTVLSVHPHARGPDSHCTPPVVL